METEILDISSDSNETIIQSKNQDLQNEVLKSLPERDDDLNYLFNKYLGGNKEEKSTVVTCNRSVPQDITSENDSSNLNKFSKRQNEELTSTSEYEFRSFDDGNLPSFPVKKKLKVACHDGIPNNFTKDSDKPECEIRIDGGMNGSKEQSKQEKEKIRQEKLKMKEKKKEEEKRSKAIKDALANHYRNMRPENCIKYIKVQIDESLTKEDFSKHIFIELQKNGISCITKSHDTSSIITWKTQLDNNILDSNGMIIDASEGTKIEEALMVMKWNEFLVHIHNKTFVSHIENLYTNLKGRKIILAIYGLGKYYQYQKGNKNREFKEDISSKSYKSSRDERIYANIPTVSRRTVEYALTEIQLLFTISHKMVENEQELAMFVFQLTKSIAQAPYKKEKQEQFIQSRWFMSEDNRNCIKIDKNGNGLSRLWKQIITTFPLASLETAEAIAAIYPTPLSLFETYENISDTNEGEKLLQDIPIRRAAGPLSTMRKIGPELSRKMYYFFTSTDPNKVL